jgi:hypothetical protein
LKNYFIYKSFVLPSLHSLLFLISNQLKEILNKIESNIKKKNHQLINVLIIYSIYIPYVRTVCPYDYFINCIKRKRAGNTFDVLQLSQHLPFFKGLALLPHLLSNFLRHKQHFLIEYSLSLLFCLFVSLISVLLLNKVKAINLLQFFL